MLGRRRWTGASRHVLATSPILATWVFLLWGIGAAPLCGQTLDPQSLDLTSEEMEELRDGGIVSKVLSGPDQRHVALVGAVLIPSSLENAEQSFLSWEPLLADRRTLYQKIDPTEAAPALAVYELPSTDISSFKRCRVGSCKVKLPQTMIQQFSEVDWQRPESRERAHSLTQRWLADYVQDYVEGGDTALLVYADRSELQPLEPALKELFGYFPLLEEQAGPLYRRLARYPGGVSRSDDFFWSVERFGLMPLTTVTHASTYPSTEGSPRTAWVVFKQIYSSHYHLASLRVWSLIEDREFHGEGTLLVYQDRALFDQPLKGLKRILIETGMEKEVTQDLYLLREHFQEVSALVTPLE